jgi:CheY-like chemotaxis protein/anti-sigma regulatory factor (Ser/Thr protein kinase)
VRAAEKNLRLTFEFSDRIPARIETDSVRLRQVLLNLIGNAIKFTHSGHVNVRTRFCAESGQLSFAIEDTGIGISECNLRKLFVPFQQADDSTTRVYGGTGLGLAISRRLANALRGEISVFSEPGKGSTFTLTMKCGPHRAEQLVMPDLCLLQPPVVPATSIQINAHVFIVDDRRDIRSLAQHFVEKAGGTVTCATNGQEAVQFLLTHSPASDSIDIVLLDMQMPVMDGYEAARRLRDAGFNKPIIALTANAMTDDRDRCLEAGCTDYTTKPLDAANLIALIASLSASGRA